jgi:predicted ATPase/class 3 adenylate cyclase
MDGNASFGLWLRRRRKALDLTQADLARRVGCAEVTIRKIEADERRPSRQIATRLADSLALAPLDRAAFLKAALGELGADRLAPPEQTRADLPTGTVTFLFTDIEGSTRLWEQHPTAMRSALARHDAILRRTIAAAGGVVFNTTGDGVHAAFVRAPDALAAALESQRALLAEAWGPTGSLQARMALHTGVVDLCDGDYAGIPLNRVARLMVVGHGGQTLVSQATAELVHDHLPPGVYLRDLGEHLLKDLTRPEHIFQLVAPDLPTDFPPLTTPDARPTNLPTQPTSLIGRDQEVATLRDRLRRADGRLLTLTGPGGVGKTRLALQVAAEVRDDFTAGVFVVNLAPLRDAHLVVSSIAQTLAIREAAGQPLIERVQEALRERELLLVLDNFEQVLDAAPQVADLLAACPRLKVLITSRAALRIRGERQIPVPPLALPDRAQRVDADAVARAPAVTLFVERAQAVQPTFMLTTVNAAMVAEICQRLDGLPLAIELAAARITLFTPAALLARLENRLQLLTGGARDLPARQQTLRNTLDWSYDMLDAGEQTLLTRLTVFVGGWTLEAAEAICAELKTDDTSMPFSIFNGLAPLLNQSLVRRIEGVAGEPRFIMLETIREYARERLESTGEATTLRRRHLAYYLALAELAEPRLSAADQLDWLDRLEQDHDNLRTALAWAVEHEPEDALRLGGALTDFWDTRGYHGEGRQWLDRALARAGAATRSGAERDDAAGPQPSASTVARTKALHSAGRLAHAQEDNMRAEALFVESLTLARAQGDPGRIALIAPILSDLGELALHQGDTARATALYTEGLALARAADDRGVVGRLLLGLGDVAQAQGDLRAAASCYEESLTLRRALDDRRGIAWALHALGQLARAQGAWQRAAEAFAEGLALARAVGDQENTAWLLYHTGHLAMAQRDLAGAAARFVESARLLHALGAGQGVALNLVGLAAVMIQQQELAQAARLLSVAEARHWVASSSWWVAADRAMYDRTVAAVRAHLDQATFAMAWAEGRAMTLEQAVTDMKIADSR